MTIAFASIGTLFALFLLAHLLSLQFYLWHKPLNGVHLWWSRDNLRRCSIGWSNLKGKRDNHSLWWAIAGFSGTVLRQTWPWQNINTTEAARTGILSLAQAIQRVDAAVIELSKSGQRTSTPSVHISACSKRGMATIMTEADDVQGNAKIKMYGETYASILGVELVDLRHPKEPLLPLAPASTRQHSTKSGA